MSWRHLTAKDFHVHLRCAAYIASAAVFASFVGIVFFRFQHYELLADAERGAAADTRRLQIQLSTIAAERGSLEDKIAALRDAQTTADTLRKSAAGHAPFPIDGVMSSIVQIVCIDNKNRNVYYTGSGTVIDASGLILTNRHLLRSGDGSLIHLCGVGFTADLHKPPKIDFVASVLATNDGIDLAVLHINERLDKKQKMPSSFPSLDLVPARKSSIALGLGDPIFIGGYPGIGADTFTFTEGVVSGRVGDELIKTSALIDSGASGGAAFDANGLFVGVPTAAAKGNIGGSLGYLISGASVDTFLGEYYAGRKVGGRK